MEVQDIAKLRAGDEQFFKNVYNSYYALLCRFATRMLNNNQLAEEVVDDVIFYLWDHRKDIEITYSLRAYLIRSVRNRCLNELKSLAYSEEIPFSSFVLPENMEFLETVFSDTDHPLGCLLEQELEDELNKNIALLPKECQLVFKMSRNDQKKYEEIADELGISVNTVKYHMKNAISFLRTQLNQYLKLILIYIYSSFQ